MKPRKMAKTVAGDDLVGIEREVAILLSDMVGYSRKTADMRPTEIRDFMLQYHRNLKKIVHSICGKSQNIESSAGDGAVALFQRKPGQGKDQICGQALDVALEMVRAMTQGIIPDTRIGLFTGDLIEATLDGNIMRFGASFSVASRLEELCGYFGTKILMDRGMAFWQTEHSRYLVCIGKVTPKNFMHPVHIFSIYKPGVHQCPVDVDKKKLLEFIEKKNRAIEVFCGNVLQGIHPDFPLARQRLLDVQGLFVGMTGQKDVPTERILEYIGNHPSPEEDFRQVGMRIGESGEQRLGIRLLNLSSELFKALNQEFYQALVVDTAWERKFKLVWRKENELIIHINDNPDGIYFIDEGSVAVLDANGLELGVLNAGDVFGEMAYFSKKGLRNATVIAKTDLVLRRISGEDLKDLPTLRKIFKRIKEKRKGRG